MTMLSPVWMPIGSKFSMLQTVTQLSSASRTTSYSTSFQPSRYSSMRTWGAWAKAFFRRVAELGLVLRQAAAPAAEGEGDPDHDRVADLRGDRAGRPRESSRRSPRGDLRPTSASWALKSSRSSVFSDGLDRRAEHGDAVAGEDPRFRERHAAVERGLAAEGEQDAVGLLPGDHLLDEIGRHRQEIDLVGEVSGGLDRGDVGVDEDDLEALLLQGLDGLAAGVVELAGLADLERPAAEDEDFPDPAVRHRGQSPMPLASRRPCPPKSSADAPASSSFQAPQETVEQEFGVGRAGRGLGMELDAHERLGDVPDALVRPVVGVREPGLPGPGEAPDVDREAVVLARDVAARRALLEAGLVLAAVAELELVGVGRRRRGRGSGCRGRCRAGGRSRASGLDRGDRLPALLGVAGAVGDDDARGGVVQDAGGVGRGRHADDAHAAAEQALEDAELRPAVDQDDGRLGVLVVDLDFLGRDLGDEVALVRVGDEPGFAPERAEVDFREIRFEDAEHHPVDAELLGQGPGVDPGDAGDAAFLEPVGERLFGGRVGGVVAPLADDVAPDPRLCPTRSSWRRRRSCR